MGNEMIDAAVICIVITLVGLALGFGLLKLQGEYLFCLCFFHCLPFDTGRQ